MNTNASLRASAAAIFAMLLCVCQELVLAAVGTSAVLVDSSGGDDWPAYGRTYGEQHYSPAAQVNASNVSRLGLAWFMDLEPGNSVTIPVEVAGVLYFASGLSVVHAVDVSSGKLLWMHDTHVAAVAGPRLRQGWGSRGIAYWNGKLYTATGDGRLVALDAQTGREVWSVQTLERGDVRYITGAPRIMNGKVIIGHAGADVASIRGYVTTYDADTGKRLWRFYTVPGNPANGFEDKALAMAANTWSGHWWNLGGGGAVWNAITYDPQTDTVYIGTSNGAPWNHQVRDAEQRDNLFLCSIIALNATTGEYKWHYQVNPADDWDFDATSDIELADLKIDGHVQKVLMTAPKNGFFYVIDRLSGQLISAEKIAKVTWASSIDIKTGRPVEVAGARYPNGSTATIWPSPGGSHSWMPMAFSPQVGLAFIPINELGANFSDKDIDIAHWKRAPGAVYDLATAYDLSVNDPLQGTSYLLAWNPVTQQQAWKVKTPYIWNGGVLVTGGNLVFQGQVDQKFNAYAADSGRLLWSFPAGAAILAAPISYTVKGIQYVTVLTGMGASGALMAKFLGPPINPQTQAKRVLTFMLDGDVKLPANVNREVTAIEDRDFKPDPTFAATGAVFFARACAVCHGSEAFSGGAAPDLRASAIPLTAAAFESVVRGGALTAKGMPRFEEYDDVTLEALREYIRTQAGLMREQLGSNSSHGR